MLRKEVSHIRVSGDVNGIELNLYVEIQTTTGSSGDLVTGRVLLQPVGSLILAEENIEWNWEYDNDLMRLTGDIKEAVDCGYPEYSGRLTDQFIQGALSIADAFVAGDFVLLREYRKWYPEVNLRIDCRKESMYCDPE